MNTHRLRDINFILLAVAIVLAILLVYQIFRPLDLPVMTEERSDEKITTFPSLNIEEKDGWIRSNYNSIVDLNLFSSDREPPSKRATPLTEDNGEGSVAYEGYELIGTVLSDEERSFALIRKGGIRGETESYRLRDDVGGMELQEILYDRVILTKNGREIVLLLQPREEEKKANVPPPKKTVERRKKTTESSQSRAQTWTTLERKDK